ncbi:MAG: TPM domain-containing protein [Bacillota bacterium]
MKRSQKSWICALAGLAMVVLLPTWTLAQTQLPAHRGAVNDYAGVLNAAEQQRLEAISRELHAKTTAALVVAIVPTHAPDSLEDYATKLFRHWGIGEKGKDNGVLILLAMEERSLKIEVGYGLEDVMTDARSGQIRDLMLPHFTQGNFGRGLEQGMRAAAVVIAGKYNVSLESTGDFRVRDLDPKPDSTLVIIAVVTILLLAAMTIGKLASGRARCPKCRGRMLVTDRVIQVATASTGGLAVKVYKCTKCGFTSEAQYRTNRAATIGPGTVFTGGGPMWGGGARGSGRSSPGRGFGGFGGGRSGGGGARGKW